MVVGVKLNALVFCLPNDKTSQLSGRKCRTLIKKQIWSNNILCWMVRKYLAK